MKVINVYDYCFSIKIEFSGVVTIHSLLLSHTICDALLVDRIVLQCFDVRCVCFIFRIIYSVGNDYSCRTIFT